MLKNYYVGMFLLHCLLETRGLFLFYFLISGRIKKIYNTGSSKRIWIFATQQSDDGQREDCVVSAVIRPSLRK
jgi:hypothetical protein